MAELGRSLLTHRELIGILVAKIVELAGLENFVDSPVRTYSSGMHMRLGFSVAGHDLAMLEHWCDTAAHLDEGRMAAPGAPAGAVAACRAWPDVEEAFAG
jgi:ABC-type polysaccharide/polyol phosphate transport system ATPase subunit